MCGNVGGSQSLAIVSSLISCLLGAGQLGGAHAVYYTGDLTLDRLTTQFNLAGVLDDMGEWDEARNL
jgi:hypothetical protein